MSGLATLRARPTGLRRVFLLFPADAKATVAGLTLALLLLAGTVGPAIAPQNPYDLAAITILDSKLPPGAIGHDGFLFSLGSDVQGRDMLSAMLYGLRTSLAVSLTAGFAAMLIGSPLGLLAGYLGGRIDTLIMRVVDLALGMPAIFVAMMLLALFGKGSPRVVLALILVQWAFYARVSRNSALVERNKDYVTAATALGLSRGQILLRHILPNSLPPIVVLATLQVATAISIEATLSFLGLGLPITQPSLGLLIANGHQLMLSGYYWVSVYPGLLLLILVFSINLVGDRLRDILNPRLE